MQAFVEVLELKDVFTFFRHRDALHTPTQDTFTSRRVKVQPLLRTNTCECVEAAQAVRLKVVINTQ